MKYFLQVLIFHTGASYAGFLFFRCARKLSISIFLQINHLPTESFLQNHHLLLFYSIPI